MYIFSGAELSHLTLSERVQSILRERIIDQQIAPGRRLVAESIAQELGVSHTPVREALSALHKTGIVEYIPRKGAYVIRLGKSDVDEIYDMRKVLEGLAVYRATSRVSEGNLAKIREDLEFSERGFEKGNVKAYVEGDTSFHDRIIANCGSRRLQEQLDRIHDLVLLYRTWGATHRPLMSLSVKEHREVLDGMVQRDQNRAEEWMRQHVESNKIWQLENYPFDAESPDRYYTRELEVSEG